MSLNSLSPFKIHIWKISGLSTVLLLAVVAFCVQSFGQGKARITIKKNDGGVITEEYREIELDSIQNMNSILKNLGVLDEFGIHSEGQQFEINIDQHNGIDDKNLQFKINPNQFEKAEAGPVQPYLGVTLKDNKTDDPKVQNLGVIITEIVAGSAAEISGLKESDIITQIDQLKINATSDALAFIKSKKPEDELMVKIKRDGKSKNIKAVLGSRSISPALNRSMHNNENFVLPTEAYNFEFDLDSIMIFPDLKGSGKGGDSLKVCQPFTWRNDGMNMKETAFLGVTPSPEQATAGVPIRIESNSSAQEMGLVDGDVILGINKKAVNTFGEIAEIIGSMKPGDAVEINYQRESKQQTVIWGAEKLVVLTILEYSMISKAWMRKAVIYTIISLIWTPKISNNTWKSCCAIWNNKKICS